MGEPEEGFFILKSAEKEKCLVYGYHCSDMKGQFVFGFNTYDGGGLIPLNDLSETSTFHRVDIKEMNF